MRIWVIGVLATVAATAAYGKSGREVYEATCAACHASGVAGAPKLGDKGQWAARVGAGRDTLATSVIRGKGAMPPRGGDPKLDDSDIRNAVDYILKAVR